MPNNLIQIETQNIVAAATTTTSYRTLPVSATAGGESSGGDERCAS
jgi:hypothetical protein